MRGDLAPPLDSAEPFALPSHVVLAVSVAALTVSGLFYAVLLSGGSLHGYDWASHHWNYFDWVRASIVEYGTLPLFMNDAWITKNFLANAEAPSLGPLVWLLFFLSTDAYIKLLLVAYTAAGLAGTSLLARDLGASPPVAAAAAAVFSFGGFFVSHLCVGHHWAMGAQLLPLLLMLYRRAVFGSTAALWLAAAANAFTILAGQHQPFIWQNLWLSFFAVAWGLTARSRLPLMRWFLVVLATAGLGAVKLLPMWLEFADYDPSARVGGIPPGVVVASLVGGGQAPETLQDGVAYVHGSGWWEYAFYVGPLGLAFLLCAAAAGRRAIVPVVLGAFFLVLSLQWSPRLAWLDVWSHLEGLPVWRTQRGPSRFLFLALFSVNLAAIPGAERLYAAAVERWRRPATLVAWMLAGLLFAHVFVESLPWQRAALGPALQPGDHRPKPLRVEAEGGGWAELSEFAPNRLVYRAQARQKATFRFPFRLGEGTDEWRVTGLPAHTVRGKLAVDVPPGERDIVMVYRPEGFYAGVGVSAVTLLALGVSMTWRPIRPRA